MAECMATVGGLELCFEEIGDAAARPLLLIMGLGGPMIWWDDEFCALIADRGFRVIRYDNRDTGRSARMTGQGKLVKSYLRREPTPYTLDDMADDAANLLTHLGIPVADVVGVSMGGMIAQNLAIRHPARVRSLTSMMSTTGARTVGWVAPRILSQMFKSIPPGEESYVENSVAGFRRIGTQAYIDVGAERQRTRARATWARGINPAGTMRQMSAIVSTWDRTAALGGLRIPACVIHGTADPLVHVSGGRATARAIPEAELVLIPGMGHDMPAALWPVFVDAIARTAARADASARTG